MEYVRLQDQLDPAERERAVRVAADALRRGELVILPTETVYGIFANAHSADATGRLASLTFRGGQPPARYRYTWHAPSVDAVLRAIPVPNPRHRLLLRRLLPGPVRFDFRLSPPEMAPVLRFLDVAPGVLDDGGVVAVRVPSPACTRHVLELAGVPAVANRVGSAGWEPDRDLSAALKDDRAAKAGIAVALDEGLTRFGAPSTLVRLEPGGGYHVEPGGTYDDRMIDKHARLRILFVCTGNTCRSPMAEAIARSIIEEQAEGLDVSLGSAGTSAGAGAPASAQTAGALRELGIEPGEHRSRPLTRQLVADADIIYTMSAWHRDEVLALDPGAGSRTMVLDATGQDVPDPVGLPQEVYNQTAQRLKELVLRRLSELEILSETGR